MSGLRLLQTAVRPRPARPRPRAASGARRRPAPFRGLSQQRPRRRSPTRWRRGFRFAVGWSARRSSGRWPASSSRCARRARRCSCATATSCRSSSNCFRPRGPSPTSPTSPAWRSPGPRPTTPPKPSRCAPPSSRRLPAAAWAQARVRLHPSTRVVRSRYPIVSIWRAHHAGPPPCLEARPEDALVVRPGAEVEMLALPEGGAAFIEALAAGRTVPDAASAAAAEAPGARMAALSNVLVEARLLVAVDPSIDRRGE